MVNVNLANAPMYFRLLCPNSYLAKTDMQQEKEMKDFIGSVLCKTTKLHQLVGDLQSKYQDDKATRSGYSMSFQVWLALIKVPGVPNVF